MKLQGITFKSLCQNLADTEISLRRGGKVNTAAKGGRADQLDYFRKNFPEQWESYEVAFTERMQKPFDSRPVLNTIPKEGF